MVSLKARTTVSPQFIKGKPFPIMTDGLAVRELPLHGIIRIQGDAKNIPFQTAIESTLHVKLPAPERSSVHENTRLAWTGPGEWLCFCTLDVEDHTIRSLKNAFSGQFSSVTQVSDSRVCFEVSGPDANHFLSKGCAIDFERTVFLPGYAVTTRFAGLPAMLVKNADDLFALYLDIGYAAFMVDWMLDAAEEFRR